MSESCFFLGEFLAGQLHLLVGNLLFHSARNIFNLSNLAFRPPQFKFRIRKESLTRSTVCLKSAGLSIINRSPSIHDRCRFVPAITYVSSTNEKTNTCNESLENNYINSYTSLILILKAPHHQLCTLLYVVVFI